MSFQMTWVVASGRAVSVRVDLPDTGEAVGAVVVVPPFGFEAELSYWTVRCLAMEAAQRGFLTYTMTLTGDGDSQGLDGVDDLAAAWREDVLAVVGAAHAHLGSGPVHVLGIRIGAALAASLDSPLIGTRILWEPASGPAYLRRESAIRRMAADAAPVSDAPGLEMCGMLLAPEHVASIRTLTAPRRSEASSAPDVVVQVERPPSSLEALVGTHPYFTRIPRRSIAAVLSHLPVRQTVGLPAWTPRRSAHIRYRGHDLTETHCLIGDQALPGVLTTGLEGPAELSVLFTAQGSERKSGPGGLWTSSARELACSGVTSLRADRGGIGEAISADFDREPLLYTQQAVEDVRQAAQYLSDYTSRPVMGVGSCVGGWLLAKAAVSVPMSDVLAVSIHLWNDDPGVYGRAFFDRWHSVDEATALQEQATGEYKTTRLAGWARRVRLAARGYAGTAPAWQQVALRLPYEVYRAALNRSVGLPLLQKAPAQTRFLALLSPEDHGHFRAALGAETLRYLKSRGRNVDVRMIPSLDHSLRAYDGQQVVRDILLKRALRLARPRQGRPARI